MKVAIIGGGIVGLCSAFYTRKAGHEVVILEKGKIEEGTSLGNAGMIVPSHFVPLAQPGMIGKGIRMLTNPESPFFIRPSLSVDLLKWGWQFYKQSTHKHVERSKMVLKELNLQSKFLYRELTKELGSKLDEGGLVMYCKTPDALDEEIAIAEEAKSLGLKVDVLDKNALSTLEPNLDLDALGGVHFRDDAFLTPNDIIRKLHQKLLEMGVTVLENSKVERIATLANTVTKLYTPNQEIEADAMVLSAGAYSAEFRKMFQLNMPLQAGKGYSMDFSKPVQRPKICGILTEAKVAFTPMDHGLRFAGTMEIGGLDLSINQRRVNGIKKSIGDYFPAFQKQDMNVSVWSGLRPCSPDGLPYIGYSRQFENLVVATGHGMMGMSMGPITGKLISQLISGEDLAVDIAKLAVDRF